MNLDINNNLISNINDQQLEIINDNTFQTQKQAICIVACAGSGKTMTIINKITYMIKYLNCKPNEFVLTTFTKNAAEEMIKRISKNLNEDIVNELTIGTFHSIALKHITKNNFKLDANKPEPIPEEYLIKYMELIKNKYDNPYKYIFIDEYQDINQFQYDIIIKWFEKCNLLIAVGDDQQNIYTFRDTSVKYILNFCTDFGGIYKYLSTNYRCNGGIVELSNAIIKLNTDRIEKQILTGNNNTFKKPKIRFFQNDTKEKDYIREYITNIYQTDINNPTIAIISRTNKKLYKMENYLMLNNFQTIMLETDMKVKFDNSKIILTTIHGAKGLEFDYVIIINCVDGFFPSLGSDIQEERRLFYVACTRAKKELLITSIWFEKYKPSRFIYEIYDNNNDLVNFVHFTWTENKYENLMKTRKNNLLEILNNIDIKLYVDLKNKNILPSEDYFCFNVNIIHPNIEPNKIIQYSNTTDLNIMFQNMLNLCTQRIIYELLSDNILYYSYIKNDQIFKTNYYSLRSAINKYLIENDITYLKKHIDYFSKRGSEFTISTNKKDLKTLYDILSDSNFMTIDLNNITKQNKQILMKSYKNYKDKQLKIVDIVNDIFNLSICDELIKGRYSLQMLLDNYNYVDKIKLIEHLNFIYDWIKSNITLAEQVNYNYNILIDRNVIGNIDLIFDNRMIIIGSNISQKPSINEFIKYLLFWSKYNIDNPNNIVNIIQYYNPIIGKIFSWDMYDLLITKNYDYKKIYDYFMKIIT